MSGSIITVGSGDFEQVVLRSPLPVLIDFWAPWCKPCLALVDTLEKMAKRYAESISVVKVNIDENPELAEKYSIRSIPTLILMKGGELVKDDKGESKITGLLSEAELADFLDRYLL